MNHRVYDKNKESDKRYLLSYQGVNNCDKLLEKIVRRQHST